MLANIAEAQQRDKQRSLDEARQIVESAENELRLQFTRVPDNCDAIEVMCRKIKVSGSGHHQVARVGCCRHLRAPF